jgi:hypothetical protein
VADDVFLVQVRPRLSWHSGRLTWLPYN